MTYRSRKKTTKWNLFFHYVSIALMMVSGIILVPLYLKFIPVNIYGAWLATGNILVWITVIDPGISSVLQQRVGAAYGNKDFQAIKDYLAGGLSITAIIVVFMIIFGFIFAEFLSSLLNLPSNIDAELILKAFYIALIGSSLMIFSYSITAINQGLQSSLGIGIIYVIVNVLGIVLTIFLLYNGFGLLAIAVAPLFQGVGLILGNAGYLLWRIWSEKLGFSFSFSFRKISSLARLISYTFLGRLGGVLSNNIDLFIVSRFLGPESVAMLSLTRRAPEMSRMLVERPPVAFMPAISHLLGAGEIDKARMVLLRLIKMMLWLLGLLVGGFIALNDDFVRLWVGSQLFAGQSINLIICVSILLAVTTSSLANLCFALGNIKGNSIVSFVQSLLSALLVIAGAKYFGLIGVVLAPVIAMLAVSAWYFPITFSRLLKLSSKDRKDIVREVLRIIVIIVPLTLAFAILHPNGWLQFIALVAAFCLAYGAGLYLISKALRVEIRDVLQKWVIPKIMGSSLKWIGRQ